MRGGTAAAPLGQRSGAQRGALAGPKPCHALTRSRSLRRVYGVHGVLIQRLSGAIAVPPDAGSNSPVASSIFFGRLPGR